MIETVLEKSKANTRVVVERDRGAYVVRLLNASRELSLVYREGGHLKSERALKPRELSKMISLCEWIINKVSDAKCKNKKAIAVVAETVIERLYTEQEEDENG